MPRVQSLSVTELQTVLSKRIRLPDQPQSHTYYVEECRRLGIFEVSDYELDRLMAQQQRGTSRPELAIELGVDELTIQPGAIRNQPLRFVVRIEPAELEEPLQTSPILPPHGGGAARVNWSHSIALPRGGRAWQALRRSLDGPEQNADVNFVVCDASNPRVALGDGYVNLQRMLREGKEAEGREVILADSRNVRVGSIVVRVRALDALRAAEGDAGAADEEPPAKPTPASSLERHVRCRDGSNLGRSARAAARVPAARVPAAPARHSPLRRRSL